MIISSHRRESGNRNPVLFPRNTYLTFICVSLSSRCRR